ncbi:hypothetical protein [Paenibacillus daejeonensis]|nr:hypothetical protein [Paenibacillus daejeonensis]
MREWLLTHCGLPKNEIKEIYKQVVDCYYIDDFKDFRVNEGENNETNG